MISTRIVLFILFNALLCSALEQTREFNVRPGFPETVDVTVDGITCDFSYDCNGGTSEAWQITLSKTDDNVNCFIGRPNPPSYLVFSTFAAKLSGASIVSANIEGLDGALSLGSEYSIKNNQLVPGTDFKGSIGLVSMEAKIQTQKQADEPKPAKKKSKKKKKDAKTEL